jgi:hypothetical protein
MAYGLLGAGILPLGDTAYSRGPVFHSVTTWTHLTLTHCEEGIKYRVLYSFSRDQTSQEVCVVPSLPRVSFFASTSKEPEV